MPQAESCAVTAKDEDKCAPCVAIDFETSGPEAHFACSLALIRIENGEVSGRFESLLRPPSSRVWFSHIHGLRWPDLKDKPTFAEVWPSAAGLLHGAAFLLAHNAQFDRRVLFACCQAADLTIPPQPFLCTLKGARLALPKLPSRKLNDVCAHFGIPLRHHNAASDAEACAHIYLRLRTLGLNDASMRI